MLEISSSLPARRRIALAAALTAALALPAAAHASTPTVTVRIVGPSGQTLLPQTPVTTTAAAIDPDGNPADTCSGTSAAGALFDATHGNWVVKWDGAGLGYEVDGLEGTNLPPFSQNPDAFWSFFLNGTFASSGICGQALNQGDDLVFFVQCDATGPGCSSATAPDHFLTESKPSATVVQAGTPVSVTVGSVGTATGSSEALPSGVVVSTGSVSAPPNAQGVATLTFKSAGTYTLAATAPDSVPSDPQTVCVHNGNDGNCGTTAPASPTPTSTSAPPGGSPTQPAAPATPQTPSGPALALASIAGIAQGQVFAHGPRVLRGSVEPDAAGVRQILIRLERRNRGRGCRDYDGVRGRFVAARCGIARAPFFSIGSASPFSYLLPSALAPGRYVFDVEAVDNAGLRGTASIAGHSRVVFYVR